MNNDLISREATIKRLKENGALTEYGEFLLKNMPTVVAPLVEYGMWVTGKKLRSRRRPSPVDDVLYCSACGAEAYWDTD